LNGESATGGSGLRGLAARILDLLALPAVVLAALVLKAVRRIGLHRLRYCRKALLWVGVLPVRKHYYEPLADPAEFRFPLTAERRLPGIDWNIPGQLEFLRTLRWQDEIPDLTSPASDALEFRLHNGAFESGDAEYLYQMLRALKPKRLFEIGSGQSTLMACRALARNREESPQYDCRHVCIEPFEAPWLERARVSVIRKRVEEVDPGLFSELEQGDLLFIDSSHIIRPQGDVLTEYLEILPTLRPGVFVHVHDIFSPRDYLSEWIVDRMWLWNEQYLLEAFLSGNESWKVVGALNLLHHRYFDELRRACPYLSREREPGSLYIQRVK
jgi:predicted O-methyltransferase YrrM